MRVRRSIEGQRGRNKFLCDWLVQDFKLEPAARCYSAVWCGTQGSGRLPRWGQEDPAKWAVGAARRGSSGGGPLVGGRAWELVSGDHREARGEGGTQLPLHWRFLRAGNWSGLNGWWLGGEGISLLAPCFVGSWGLSLKWWFEQGRSHPKEVALTWIQSLGVWGNKTLILFGRTGLFQRENSWYLRGR